MLKNRVKEIIVGLFVGTVISITFLAFNYLGNLHKDEIYMPMYGYELNEDGEWVKEDVLR